MAGKAYFVRAGVFKDVDVVLFTHVGNNLDTSWGQSAATGLVSVEYTFRGESAHAAGAPWQGRSALDAVELMDIGWNFRREHLRLQQRSHYVITNGGDQPNVVPRMASVWYYFRELDYEHIKQMREIGDTMAQGAAMMTNTTVTSRVSGLSVAATFQQAGGGSDVRKHQAGRSAAMERGRSNTRESAAKGVESTRTGPGDGT